MVLIGRLSYKKIGIPILTIASLLVAAGVMEWFSMGASSELGQVNQNYNFVQLQLLTTEGQLKHLLNEFDNRSTQNLMQQAAESLPSSPDITEIILQVTKLAAADNISVQSITFGDQVTSATAPAQPAQGSQQLSLAALPYVSVNLTIAGTSAQVIKFINDLEHSTRLTKIQSFALASGPSTAAATTTTTVSMWQYYRPVGKE